VRKRDQGQGYEDPYAEQEKELNKSKAARYRDLTWEDDSVRNRESLDQTGESFSAVKKQEKEAKMIRGLWAFWVLNTGALIALIVGFFVKVIPWKKSEIDFLDPKIIISIAVGLIIPLVIGLIPVAFTHSAPSQKQKPAIENLWKEYTLVLICCLLTLLFYFVTDEVFIWLDIGCLFLSMGLHFLSSIDFIRYLKLRKANNTQR